MLAFSVKTYFDFLPIELHDIILRFARILENTECEKCYSSKLKGNLNLFKTNYTKSFCKCRWGNRSMLNIEFKHIVLSGSHNLYDNYNQVRDTQLKNLSKKISFKMFKQDFPNGITNPNDFELVKNDLRYISEYYYNFSIYIFKTNIYNPNLHYVNIWGCNFFSTGELAINNTEMHRRFSNSVGYDKYVEQHKTPTYNLKCNHWSRKFIKNGRSKQELKLYRDDIIEIYKDLFNVRTLPKFTRTKTMIQRIMKYND